MKTAYKSEQNLCFLCGRNGCGDPLDKHHLFGGAYRAKCEKLGLTVALCHDRCHIFGREAAHRSAETMRQLHEYGQRLAMDRFGWTEDEFRAEFGKSYLTEEPQDTGESVVIGFVLLPEDAALPY